MNEDAVMLWLSEHGIDLSRPVRFHLLTGGRSNLTYRLDAADGESVALRMSSGDSENAKRVMGREWRFITALHGGPLPVPAPIAYCADPTVAGGHFYVMEFVDGIVVDEADIAAELPPHARWKMGEGLIRALAHLHSIDPDAVGLGDIGKGEGYVERQLRLWDSQWHKWPGSTNHPLVEAVHRRLTTMPRPRPATSLVHGDYKLGNLVCGRDGTVLAVLDWELATLGHPLADVGWVLSQWPEPGEHGFGENGERSPTRVPGFPSRAELVGLYGRENQLEMVDLTFFEAMGHWKSACTIAGVALRADDNGISAESVDELLVTIDVRAGRALDLLE